MIPLVASAITKIFTCSKNHYGAPVRVTVVSDSTTITQVSKMQDCSASYGVTAYSPMTFRVDPGETLFALSTGTPNLTVIIHDAKNYAQCGGGLCP